MGIDVVIGTSWSHRLARILVRPLVGSGVTPNHLTTLRLGTGLLACVALLPADGASVWWGGALGLGLRDSALGGVAVALGVCTGAALYVCGYWSEVLERLEGPGSKAYSGAFGFDPDDLLYLLAPIIWLGWRTQLVVAACLGATFMMLLTGWRLRRLTSRRVDAGAAD